MALAEYLSGTTPALTLSASLTLNAVSPDETVGFFSLTIDLSNMLAADTLKVRFIEKVLPASTLTISHEATYTGVQSEPIEKFPMVDAVNGFIFQIEQTTGTGRTYDWSIRTA